MKIRDFIRKYNIIIFLAFLVIVLIFVKIYFGNNDNSTKAPSISIQSTPSEIKGLSKEILIKYTDVKSKEEFDSFLSTLTEDQINQLPEIDPHYLLELILPYESETFVIKSYLKANVLLVEAKGDDIEKSKNDLKIWLDEKEEGEGEEAIHTVVWENQ